MSKELTKQTNKSLNPQWKARQVETLSLSKNIIEGNAKLAQIEMGLTINETFSKPILRSVFVGDYSSVGFSVVKVLVNRFIDSFAFTTKLNDDQIDSLTVDTLESFAYESLQDIILFFKMCRSGKFGVAKKSIDSNLIFGEWYPKYLEKKAELREQDYNAQKNELNSTPITMDDVKKYHAKVEKKNFVKRVENYIDKITEYMDRQLLEDTILDWSKDPNRKPYLDLLKRKRKTIK
ncbi:hypothetical protein ACSTS3_19570 [Aquimarina muelleri]|uniref:hypothetical protein n=1 Tax=Aquimarina muelleri TaxID=279356 RepID=UPI003F688B56